MCIRPTPITVSGFNFIIVHHLLCRSVGSVLGDSSTAESGEEESVKESSTVHTESSEEQLVESERTVYTSWLHLKYHQT